MSGACVIVGAGLAGWSAAATLREGGFDGRVVLVGDEPHLPYDRPPLSKQYLRGEMDGDGPFLRPPEWYDERDIERVLGVRVERVSGDRRVVRLADGRELSYEKLLVATGGQPRRLHVPGGDLAGIMYLRRLGDAEVLRATFKPGLRLCVVGGGFIGLEVAAAACEAGVEVTVVEALEAPLVPVLGPEIGQLCARLHRDAGVEVRTRSTVEAFDGVERVTGVRTRAGDRIACDAVVVGIGIAPAVEALADSGVAIADGVVVNARCETGVPGIYAAGDVARHAHPRFGSLRVEHWQNALSQGALAARNMLGAAEPYDEVHWFWSDQHGHNLQYAGVPTSWDEIVVRGDPEAARFVAFYLRDRRVVAAFAVDRGRDLRRAQKLIDAGLPVHGAALADEGVDLRELAAVS